MGANYVIVVLLEKPLEFSLLMLESQEDGCSITIFVRLNHV
jgi:hypothetical protein